ncbi:oxygen-insensitive NAD(P)H nitroreductase [Bordetella bronchialis]|uniref:NAD(P)H nitroreductase n=1 Tax=Bordetella bronchialis TaxID=463025 RepID=A0A193FVI8_9BORD|nr:oxygen-insensitive NAD(P)H nitroreductase [Bordetella bronchialis]ANN65965.1 NAD(P)H nitroreductase [Bordetella bronchialis]ANN71049.1 NAD(P)H nitroreductase [Bordetella bronchialis]
MNTLTAARNRYTTKAYDGTRKIPPEKIEALLEVLRLSPSSVNSQPWRFIVASDDAGKARIAKAAQGTYGYNASKVMDASHVIVFAAATDMTAAHLESVLAQEERDGRFRIEGAKEGQAKGRQSYVDLHRYDRKDLQHWMEKQVYLALGGTMLAAATLGIDATPMEGFDFPLLDAELGLREQGYTSVVLLSLGYHGEKDFNARLPKSRLPRAQIMTFI